MKFPARLKPIPFAPVRGLILSPPSVPDKPGGALTWISGVIYTSAPDPSANPPQEEDFVRADRHQRPGPDRAHSLSTGLEQSQYPGGGRQRRSTTQDPGAPVATRLRLRALERARGRTGIGAGGGRT